MSAIGSERVLAEIKSLMKVRKRTYRQLAEHLNLSESNIKKIFTSNDLSFNRLNDICQFLEVSLTDILNRLNQKPLPTLQFTEEQLKYFEKNRDGIRYYWKLVNVGMTPDQIEKEFHLTKRETTKYLKHLDRLGLIKWLPNNQIRPIHNRHLWNTDHPVLKQILYEWADELTKNVMLRKQGNFNLRCLLLSKESHQELLRNYEHLHTEFLKKSDLDVAVHGEDNLETVSMFTCAAQSDLVNHIK